MGNQQRGNSDQKSKIKKAPENYVFALDIGTRSVIGIVGILEGEMLRIQAVESVEHKKRAMIDGQIEDIEQVSKVTNLVKGRLEKRLGYELKQVCVAAAGRALRTQRASFEIELEDSKPIGQDLVCRLEAGAIETAERQFEPGIGEDDQHVFYLVGYSVIEYLLDDYPISSLLEHKGKRVGVEVIATFLPREVVDSLYTTMHKTGLDVASLTLEPIAAMNATIPERLRLLNLALVDIGAGTSDIAISKDGSVVAYTMATVAGDEITEAIMKKYLVDFLSAEEIKHKLDQEEDISFQDIFGYDHTLTPAQLHEDIEPVVCSLCSEIGKDIIKANGGAPSAVFLVGGGSKLPGMCAHVAESLKLEPNRVAIGGNNFMMHVSAPNFDMTGPEFATPLGIAISAGLNLISDSFSITLNGSKAKLFRSRKLTVLDVLMMNGYSYNNLISRSGKSAVIEVNGENRIFYGGHPEVAKIKINGVESNVSALVNAGDEIAFEPAVPGKEAEPPLYEAVPFTDPGSVIFHNSTYSIGTRATVNGEPAKPEQKLKHHDRVETTQIITLGDLIHDCGESTDKDYLVNGKISGLETVLSDGDRITYTLPAENLEETAVQGIPFPAAPVSSGQAVERSQPEAFSEIQTAGFPAAEVEPHPKEIPAKEEEAPVAIHLTLNHDSLALPQKEDGTSYYLVDMLNLVDMDLSKPEGRRIVIKVNGQDAAYLQMLSDGDVIDIHWEETIH